MNLTMAHNLDYAPPTVSNEAVGIRILESRAQQALNRSAFFYAPKLWWVVWRLFGAPSLVNGNANSVQLTTLLIRIDGGDLPITHEGTIMSNLIPISSRIFHGKPIQSVDADTLSSFLAIRSEFNHWIKRRIEEYGFIQGEDYLTEVRKTGGRPKTKYFLTLDMAKELAMVERNDRGREARRYFIDCEKQLKEQKRLPALVQEAALPPELQALLDERLALYTSHAYLRIKEKLTAHAHDAMSRQGMNKLELFGNWSCSAKVIFLINEDINNMDIFARLLSDNIEAFREKLKII